MAFNPGTSACTLVQPAPGGLRGGTVGPLGLVKQISYVPVLGVNMASEFAGGSQGSAQF